MTHSAAPRFGPAATNISEFPNRSSPAPAWTSRQAKQLELYLRAGSGRLYLEPSVAISGVGWPNFRTFGGPLGQTETDSGQSQECLTSISGESLEQRLVLGCRAKQTKMCSLGFCQLLAWEPGSSRLQNLKLVLSMASLVVRLELFREMQETTV